MAVFYFISLLLSENYLYILIWDYYYSDTFALKNESWEIIDSMEVRSAVYI